MHGLQSTPARRLRWQLQAGWRAGLGDSLACLSARAMSVLEMSRLR